MSHHCHDYDYSDHHHSHHHDPLLGMELAMALGVLNQCKQGKIAQEAEKRAVAERDQNERLAEAIIALPVDHVPVLERLKAKAIVEQKQIRLAQEAEQQRDREALNKVGAALGCVFLLIVAVLIGLFFYGLNEAYSIHPESPVWQHLQPSAAASNLSYQDVSGNDTSIAEQTPTQRGYSQKGPVIHNGCVESTQLTARGIAPSTQLS